MWRSVAMGYVGMLLLSVVLVSATSSSKVQASYTRYKVKFTETIPPGGGTRVFQPLQTETVPRKGIGIVKHNNLLQTNGFVPATVGGLFFFHSEHMIEDVVTITFSEALDGVWKGSSINLRGYWKMKADGTDADNQELAIVGGQGGLRGAIGSVYYERVATVPLTQFLVTCDIYVNNDLDSIPQIYVNLDSKFESLNDAVNVQPEFTESHFDVVKQVIEKEDDVEYIRT